MAELGTCPHSVSARLGPALALPKPHAPQEADSVSVACQIFGAFWAAAPAHPKPTDCKVLLDDGTSLSAHTLYLQHASPVFCSALDCSRPALTQPQVQPHDQPQDQVPPQPQHRPGSPAAEEAARCSSPARKRQKLGMQLRLPGASQKQAQLLLHCLYSWAREAWLRRLELPELVDLARVADKFGCVAVLQLVDAALVWACETQARNDDRPEANLFGTWLSTENAPALYKLAQELHMPAYQAWHTTWVSMQTRWTYWN